MTDPLILGLHVDTHDTGAVLLRGTEILAAVNEERLSRIKEDSAFPIRSIAEVLRIRGNCLRDLDIVAISGFRPSLKKLLGYALDDWRICQLTKGYSLVSFLLWRKDRSVLINLIRFPVLLLLSFYEHSGFRALIHGWRTMKAINHFQKTSRRKGFNGKVLYVPHNLCHLATAYYTSGFDHPLLVNIEGSSFENTADIAIGEKGEIHLKRATPVPHSAGEFYKLVTGILGFKPRRHAGKITGLAAYGNPKKAYSLVQPLLSVNHDSTLSIHPLNYRLMAEYRRYKNLPVYFQNHSREDLAAAFQYHLEVVCTQLVKEAIAQFRPGRLALCGGVAANVKMNQRLAALPGIEQIFVHPGMGDTGQALGAALFIAYHQESRPEGAFHPQRIQNVFWGPEFSEAEILKAIHKADLKAERPESIEVRTAALLARGRVVARFWGRMEYGPRALGNRSILYRPDDPSVNDWLNKRLQRTEFMPFAPATLVEYADKCYEDIGGKEYTAEFMTITCDCTKWMKQTCPGVVHVDGTARPQLITESANPGLYRVLQEYRKLTGIPSVINTSFNMHEEPIVCTPEDAIRTFLQGHLDHLAIGPYLLNSESPETSEIT